MAYIYEDIGDIRENLKFYNCLLMESNHRIHVWLETYRLANSLKREDWEKGFKIIRKKELIPDEQDSMYCDKVYRLWDVYFNHEKIVEIEQKGQSGFYEIEFRPEDTNFA